MSSPKACLHLIYLHSKQPPRYETVPVPAEKVAAKNGTAISTSFLVKPLSSQQSGFRCTLYLPDYSPVVSDVFAKKKEAEQDAARKALDQMGKSFTCEDSALKALSSEEKVVVLVERLEAIFSEKVVMSCQPLKEHFRVALSRKDGRTGAVPAAALAVLDNKIGSLCKSLHESSENDSLFALAMVLEAAARSSSVDCEEGFWIKCKNPFTPHFQAEFLRSGIRDQACLKFQAVYIPLADDQIVTGLEIEVEPHGYYLDTLAKNLGVKEGSGIIMSRSIPKASSDTRLYYAIPDMQLYPKPFETNKGVRVCEQYGLQWNKRASKLLCSAVYGDAVLASVGSTWKSEGKLICSNVPLSCYYRLLLGRTPEGNYKLSRDAILISKLASSFSSRAQWRGALPRSLLIDFCHQHRLADPEFSFISGNDPSGITSEDRDEKVGNNSTKCRTRVVYEGKAIEFESEHHYGNRNDAVQSAALQALHFLSRKIDILPEFSCNNCAQGGQLSELTHTDINERNLLASSISANSTFISNLGFDDSTKAQYDSNKTMVSGSMVFIAYDVRLVSGSNLDVKLESNDEFEFEFGVGGIVSEVENMVSGMQVGACKELFLPVPNLESIFSTHEDALHGLQKFDIGSCSLKYVIKLLKSLEPPEDRMESALFSPPLSKQRNEFAVRKIKEIHAKSLVDLGCGSGSLLDSVLEHSKDLEYIAGVDVSLKSLLRAAKSLNTKLTMHGGDSDKTSGSKLKRMVLYEGSIAESDPCLCGFDVATCIEVVEHLDPEPLLKAADVILGTYRPQMLIVSTPNIEYNVLLQKLTTEAKNNAGEYRIPVCLQDPTVTDDQRALSSTHSPSLAWDGAASTNGTHTNMSDYEARPQPIRLRNDDHRFEWTRVEFQEWASHLALRFGYTVEYTGVGGSVEDPGFASQIAVFTRNSLLAPDLQSSWEDASTQKGVHDANPSPCYREVWKYDKRGLHG